ncbi:MAG: S41 family peptidase [Pseudomonadota bacterium]
MQAVFSRGYVPIIQVVSAFFLFLTLGCDAAPRKNQLYLDRDFASYCEAFEASAKLALHFHLQRTEADFPTLRGKTAPQLAQDLKLSPPADPAWENCADIEAIGKEAQSNGKAPTDLELYQAALKAFTKQLDPDSSYRDPIEIERSREVQANQRYGIGVEFRRQPADAWRKAEDLVVEEVFPGSPAEGRLEKGDRISEIDGKSVQELMPVEAIQATQPATKAVVLHVSNRNLDVPIVPEKYKWIPVMKGIEERSSFRAGYLKIRTFAKDTAKLAESMLRELQDDGADGFLIDLRDNSGGIMDEAVRITADLTGKNFSVFTRGNPAKRNATGTDREYGSKPGWTPQGAPVVVLIDAGSASAAEVVAGGVWTDAAPVVGDRSYGKGVGQSEVHLSDRKKNNLGGMFLLVMFRYEFADGFCPQLVSILPHVPIPDTDLANVLAAQHALNRSTILREEDFGKDWVVASSNGVHRTYSARLASQISEINRRRDQTEDFAAVCESADDCAKEKALAYLGVLHEAQ